MMGLFIQRDPFLMAMIDQIDINPQRQFELVPKIGEQIIFFGDASDLDLKFEKLKLFYKKIIPVYGWSKYSKINLAYKGQLVTTIRGEADVAADSIRTLQLMKVLAAYSSLMSADTSQVMIQDNDKNTTDVNLINKSLQREDSDNGNTTSIEIQTETKTPAALPVVKPAVKIVEVKMPVTKPVEKKTEIKKPAVISVTKKTETKKPAVVTMPKKSPPASVKPKKSVAKTANDY
jgi:cell division protein FtsQ